MKIDVNLMLKVKIMIDIREIYSLTDFQRNAQALISRLKETGKPEILTVKGQAKVIVQDAAAYQELLDRIDTVESIRRGLKAMKNGEGRNVRDFFAEFENKHGI